MAITVNRYKNTSSKCWSLHLDFLRQTSLPATGVSSRMDWRQKMAWCALHWTNGEANYIWLVVWNMTFIFPYMRGRSTTNQICYVCIWRCWTARQQAGWDGESWAWHSSLAPTILAGAWISAEKMVGVTYLKHQKKRNSKNGGSKKMVLPCLKHNLAYF